MCPARSIHVRRRGRELRNSVVRSEGADLASAVPTAPLIGEESGSGTARRRVCHRPAGLNEDSRPRQRAQVFCQVRALGQGMEERAVGAEFDEADGTHRAARRERKSKASSFRILQHSSLGVEAGLFPAGRP
jgi:hypothetical protein